MGSVVGKTTGDVRSSVAFSLELLNSEKEEDDRETVDGTNDASSANEVELSLLKDRPICTVLSRSRRREMLDRQRRGRSMQQDVAAAVEEPFRPSRSS